ncbi:hypothetical protein GGI18_001907 [Coemansia linderi]|uniref:Uncharacterized protein n=1 Tax=Coemansia linderi TaxID=2663919 RepID=A0ACC1KIG9_9FUNG|nr:hypothetical protein GGI18_001907 [Coemansia linderi]
MKLVLRTSVLLALTSCVWASVAAPQVTSSAKALTASNSRADAPAIPPAPLDTHGNLQRILCQLNHDRQTRYLSPIFLHQTMSQVAKQLSDTYIRGFSDSSTYNSLFYSRIAPLGSSVSSSYKILGILRSNQPAANSVMNGIDLPKFVCAINKERIRARADTLVVHTALASEAEEQVKVMKQLGHYTVDGPRFVDEAIYSQHVDVVKLYWMAGEGFRNENALVNLLVSNYRSTVLDPNFTSIGVAQLNGFWSVILASQSRAPTPGTSCPLTIDEVTFIS